MNETLLIRARYLGKEARANYQRMPIMRDLSVDLGKDMWTDFNQEERAEILEAWYDGWLTEDQLHRRAGEVWR